VTQQIGQQAGKNVDHVMVQTLSPSSKVCAWALQTRWLHHVAQKSKQQTKLLPWTKQGNVRENRQNSQGFGLADANARLLWTTLRNVCENRPNSKLGRSYLLPPTEGKT